MSGIYQPDTGEVPAHLVRQSGVRELVPATSLPLHVGAGGYQEEGRGSVELNPDRAPAPLFDRLRQVDDITQAEYAHLAAAVTAYAGRRKPLDEIFASVSANTDAVTGNLVLELFRVPAGTVGLVTNVTVDLPAGGATGAITPTAPFANAASWSFLALGNIQSSGMQTSNPTALRPALVAFAPVTAAGPILPGQWTFSDKNGPVGQANETLYYCLVGGSQAALVATPLQATFRVQLYGLEAGIHQTLRA